MFGKRYVDELISRSAENAADRLRFLKCASAAGLGLVGAGLLRWMATPALSASAPDADAISDSAILNFALNLEYLEAEFYSYAVHGDGLPEDMTHGNGQRGPVEGGREVPFKSRVDPPVRHRDRPRRVRACGVLPLRARVGRGRPAGHQHPARASPTRPPRRA